MMTLHDLHHRLVLGWFLARHSIYAIARYMPSPARPSVRLSVCLILGSRNLHHIPWL